MKKEPAFPIPGDDKVIHADGMSLRDYFAAVALPTTLKWLSRSDPLRFAAERAYHIADELLAVREQRESKGRE